MNTSRFGCALMLACALPLAGWAQGDGPAPTWTQRELLVARVERLAEADLKAMSLRCDSDATRRMLGFEEAAHCSIAFEVLKQRSFGGDFGALLAWWRLHRDGAPRFSVGGQPQ